MCLFQRELEICTKSALDIACSLEHFDSGNHDTITRSINVSEINHRVDFFPSLIAVIVPCSVFTAYIRIRSLR